MACLPAPLQLRASNIVRDAARWMPCGAAWRRALLALAALAAIGYDTAAGPGVTDADYFSYFTVLSNLFVAAMLLHGALRPAQERSRTVELLRGASVAYILTTGIVYLFLLSGRTPTHPWVNAILHYVMPVAVTLDWLLDPPRLRLDRVQTVVPWIVFPLHWRIVERRPSASWAERGLSVGSPKRPGVNPAIR